MDIWQVVKKLFGSQRKTDTPKSVEKNRKETDLDNVKIFKTEITTKDSKEKIEEAKILSNNAVLSKNGLKPYEILMIYYAPKIEIGQNEFQQFWLYEYGVENPSDCLDKLCEMGFVTHGSAIESLDLLTISELKNILKQTQNSQTGNKTALIERIKEKISRENIEILIPRKFFSITEKGENELKSEQYVIYFHKKKTAYGMSMWQVNEQLQNYPHRLWRDIIWRNLNQGTEFAFTEKKKGIFSPYANNRYMMCDFLIEENRNLDTALKLLIEAMFYDINFISLENFNKELQAYEFITQYSSNMEREKPVLEYPHLSPHTVDNLRILQNRLNYSDEELYEAIFTDLNSYKMAGMRFSVEELLSIITAEHQKL